MNNPKDIRFRRMGNVVVARIKVGKKWIDKSDNWHTVEEAREPAIKLRDELQAQYAEDHPEPEKPAEQPREWTRKGFRQELEEELARMAKRQCWATDHNYKSVTQVLWRALGEHADLPTKELKPKYFVPMRELLISGEYAQGTVEIYGKNLREMLRWMEQKGLDPQCVLEVTNLPRVGIKESGDDVFQRGHLGVMFKHEAEQDDTTRILFWIGLSGGPQMVDAVFLPIQSVDLNTGFVSYNRVKTGEVVQYCALPPLIELLRKRKEALGPGAAYFLPELIYNKKHLKKPGCNKELFEKLPERYKQKGSHNGGLVMRRFLNACGIESEELSYKSFRKHNISFWASIGIKLKVRMRMAGHNQETTHHRYDCASEMEINRASQLTWEYLQSVRDGREFFVPTTPYDMYQGLLKHWAQIPDVVRATMHSELGGSFDNLRSLLLDAFTLQTGLIKQQTAILQAENAQLREQLRELREQLREQSECLSAIKATCQQIAVKIGAEAGA